MSKMHDPPEPMQGGYYQQGASVPYTQAPPPYLPESQRQAENRQQLPPAPSQPIFNQPQSYQPPVIQTVQTISVPYFRVDPTPTICPHCQQSIVTYTRPVSGSITYATSIICCLIGCYLCCLFPFCMDSLQDVEHVCPNCEVPIGIYKRW